MSLDRFKNKKTALVLSGGVVKAAAWHIGVGKALEDLGFSLKSNTSEFSELEISTYVGSSAGALINLFFASGFSPQDIINSLVYKDDSKLPPIGYGNMLSFKKPMRNPPSPKFYDPLEGFPSLLKRFLGPLLGTSGLFTTQGLNDYIKNNVIKSNSFEDYDADMFVVATQLDHSRKVLFSKYNYPSPVHDSTACYYKGISIAESVTASMSVPPFYSPYPVLNPQTKQTDYYIDGEIRETLSTHAAIDNGCDFIISSWTHTPYHYHDEIGSLVNYRLPAICTQAIFLMIQKKIVSARDTRRQNGDVINTVNTYLKDHSFDDKKRNQLVSILERKLNYKPDVELIDIYPDHKDYKLFFKNSFSLNQNNTQELIKAGYKRTMEVFK